MFPSGGPISAFPVSADPVFQTTWSGSASFSMAVAGVSIAIGRGSASFQASATGSGLSSAVGSGSLAFSLTASGQGSADAKSIGSALFNFLVTGSFPSTSSGSAALSFTVGGQGITSIAVPCPYRPGASDAPDAYLGGVEDATIYRPARKDECS